MRKSFRKAIAVVLTVILVFSLFTALPLTVTAVDVESEDVSAKSDSIKVGYTSHSQSEAVAWIKARGDEGWWKDVDGVYGCQCVDFIQAYYQFFGYSGMSGYAWQYQSGHIPSGSNWYYSNTPIPGSVFVQNKAAAGNDTGHVGLVYALDATFLYTVETNIGGNGNGYDRAEARYNKRYRSGVTTYINPDFGPNFNTVYMGEHFYANIINPSSGKAVVATGDNAGSNVVLQSLDGILLHKWEFIHLGNNAYKIVNNHSGKVLDVNAGSNVTGTNVQVWDSLDNIAQKWYFKGVGNGYSLVPECAPNLCLDIYNGYTSNGTNIQICTENNSNAQIFTLNILPSFVAQNLGEHFFANIIHKQSGKAVVAIGDNTGDNVVLKTLDGILLHKWEFIRQSDWSYIIVNNHSGKALDVNGCSDANNTNVQVWDAVGSIAQLWYFREAANGGYSLVPKCALNSALDLRSGNTSEGANIEIYSYQDSSTSNHSNQTFCLNYTPSFVAQNLGEHFYANIVHLDSDKPIVAVGDNGADNVELGEFSGAIIKKWEFIRQNDWSYIIINNHSGKALDVNGGYTENMTNIQVYKLNNSNAQRWYIKAVGSGYSLVPKCALESALDLENGLAENGTNISLHKQNSTAAQIFYFNLQPTDIALDIGESFDAYIIHNSSGYAVSYNAVGNTIVQQNEYAKEQRWHFERQKDMSYIISNRITDIDTELFMSVDNQYDHDGANVQINSANGLNGQRWYIIKNGSGYSLIPKCAVNRAMDLAGGNTENGDIEIWGLEHGNPNQIFEINVISPTLYILGDTNLDGHITISDVTAIQRHLAELDIFGDEQFALADTNGDGEINIADATHLQKYLAEFDGIVLGKA